MAEEYYPKAIMPAPPVPMIPYISPHSQMMQSQTNIYPPIPYHVPVPVPALGFSYLIQQIVADGFRHIPRGPYYAMSHVAILAYLMGAGCDYITAHMYADLLSGGFGGFGGFKYLA